MPKLKERTKKTPAVPADKTPDCPPHWWYYWQEMNGVTMRRCLKPQCRVVERVDTESMFCEYLPDSFQERIRYGITQKKQAYYRPVEIFRI